MFSSNKSKDRQFAAGGTTLLACSVTIQGDIKFAGNLEVEGVVEGNIYAEKGADARVRIMGKGKVDGDIFAPKIVINGTVNGNVHASKHLELASNAIVMGDVHYQVIEMVKGSQVNGKLVFETETSRKQSATPANLKKTEENPNSKVSALSSK